MSLDLSDKLFGMLSKKEISDREFRIISVYNTGIHGSLDYICVHIQT